MYFGQTTVTIIFSNNDSLSGQAKVAAILLPIVLQGTPKFLCQWFLRDVSMHSRQAARLGSAVLLAQDFCLYVFFASQLVAVFVAMTLPWPQDVFRARQRFLRQGSSLRARQSVFQSWYFFRARQRVFSAGMVSRNGPKIFANRETGYVKVFFPACQTFRHCASSGHAEGFAAGDERRSRFLRWCRLAWPQDVLQPGFFLRAGQSFWVLFGSVLHQGRPKPFLQVILAWPQDVFSDGNKFIFGMQQGRPWFLCQGFWRGRRMYSGHAISLSSVALPQGTSMVLLQVGNLHQGRGRVAVSMTQAWPQGRPKFFATRVLSQGAPKYFSHRSSLSGRGKDFSTTDSWACQRF